MCKLSSDSFEIVVCLSPLEEARLAHEMPGWRSSQSRQNRIEDFDLRLCRLLYENFDPNVQTWLVSLRRNFIRPSTFGHRLQAGSFSELHSDSTQKHVWRQGTIYAFARLTHHQGEANG